MTTESPSPRLTFRFRSSELLATALQSLPQDPLCPWPPWHHGLAHPLRVSGLPFDVASLWDPRGAGRRRFSHPVSVRLCPSRPLVSTPVLLGLFEALRPSDGATSSDEGAQRRGNFRERPDTFAAQSFTNVSWDMGIFIHFYLNFLFHRILGISICSILLRGHLGVN